MVEPYKFKGTFKVGFPSPVATKPLEKSKEGQEVLQEYLDMVARERMDEMPTPFIRRKR